MTTISSGTSLESATPLDASTPVITEGCYAVVCKVGGEHMRVVRLTLNSTVLIEKLKFEAESAFGHPFGIFEVIGKRLVPTTVEDLRKRDGEDIEMAAVAERSDSNGNDAKDGIAPSALDVDTRQTATEEEILQLKEEGGTASDVVSRLVEGNASFATRTTYAKSKYIRRKTRKHSDRVLILKPTVRLLCESYLKKDSDRAGNLRIDQLAQIVYLGAVHVGRKVMVFDQVLGLVSAAVVERLAGAGACIHLHRGTMPQSIPAFNAMTFKQEELATFFPIQIDSVLNGFVQVEQPAKAEKMETGEGDARPDRDPATTAAAAARRTERLDREKAGLDMANGGVDTLLIAIRSVEPVSLLEVLWPKLRPAGNVVVYSPTVEHCIRAQQWLRAAGTIHINFSDQMYRVHQVLPDRTHPLMSQSVVGGYVLAGIKIQDPVPTS